MRPLDRLQMQEQRSRAQKGSSGTLNRWRPVNVTDQKRSAELTRKTGETDVALKLSLDGDGAGSRDTGVGFLDHMLDLFARHGHFDVDVQATGDLKTGAHH